MKRLLQVRSGDLCCLASISIVSIGIIIIIIIIVVVIIIISIIIIVVVEQKCRLVEKFSKLEFGALVVFFFFLCFLYLCSI